MVTRYVNSMLRDSLLKELPSSVTAIGRTPKLFSLNADYGYIIGVELGSLHMAKIGIFKFDGSFISNSSLCYVPEWDAKETIDNVIDAVEGELAASSIDRGRILHIVIGNPGVVNPDTGSIELAARSAKWSKLPLNQIFQQHFGVQVKIVNDVNLSALGEKERGEGHGYQNFILVRQTVGLKAGIILKERLYQGESHAAGEIGHSILSVVEDGEMIRKNAESLLSLSAICNQIASKLHDHPNDIFYSITGGNPKNVTVENIVKALGKPSYVNDCIGEAGEMLGYVLVNTVVVLDIALIILSGEITKFNNYYIKGIRKVLSEHLPHPPTVLISSLGDDAALHGAFAIGQESVLANIPNQ